MTRFPAFRRFDWIRPTHTGWRAPLGLGLALLLLATVCLHALPAAASQDPGPVSNQSAELFCLLFKPACPPTTYALPAHWDGKTLPAVFLGSDDLDHLPADGEPVVLMPLTPAADVEPQVRLYLVDWLKAHGFKLPAWLSK